MTWSRLAILLPIVIGVAQSAGQPAAREPHLGYLYPAGGRQGTTFHLLVGGQSLRGTAEVHVTGEGVRATVLQYYPPLRNLSPEQRDALGQTLRSLLQERWSELARLGKVREEVPWSALTGLGVRLRGPAREAASNETAPAELPAHPLLYELRKKSLRELLHAISGFKTLRKGQRSPQLAESVLLEIAIDDHAPPGDRELRLLTRQGLTNPMTFQVGTLPEICELELDASRLAELLPEEPALAVPVLLNGQILPGDVDRFRFQAAAGQRLVIATQARRLVPYIADAVPGWFQATVTLRDDAGRELAYADDYRFDPDPVLLFDVPRDGVYDLEIRDSLYRGREDFVYRVSISQNPFITSIFPLGCGADHGRFVAVSGWNLGTKRLFLSPPDDESEGILQQLLVRGTSASNPVAYAADALRSTAEAEPNDSLAEAQRVRLPRMIDGRIERTGDVDVFAFEVRKDTEIVAEVTARRLDSPIDSLLRLLDEQGATLAWNDDHELKEGYLRTETGAVTHSADSYVRTRLPAGQYFVQVIDAQSRGGDDYAYRLRIGEPEPSFAVRVTPSSLNVRSGLAVPLTLHALRMDGFDGDIEVYVPEPASRFVLSGARIPAGRNSVRATLTVSSRLAEPTPLALAGRVLIDRDVVVRPVAPAEDMMQAFLYRHLIPSQMLLVAAIGGPRGGRTPAWADRTPLRIPLDGTACATLRVPAGSPALQLDFELNEPPPGIRLEQVTPQGEGLVFEFAVDNALAEVGPTENLIVEAFRTTERDRKGNPAGNGRQRVSLGFLPALPAEVVRK